MNRSKNVLGEVSDHHDMLVALETAAKLLQIDKQELYRAQKTGRLPVVDIFNGIGRIRLSDAQKIVTSLSHEAPLVSKKSAAKMLGISKSKLLTMLKFGRLSTAEIRHVTQRIRLSDIHKVIASTED